MKRWVLLLLWAFYGVAPARTAQTLTLAVEDDWFPYAAERNGQPEGFAVDVVREAYRAVGVDVTLKSMPYARCMRVVRYGHMAGCFNSLKDASTVRFYLFHNTPLFVADIGIYRQTGAPLRRPLTVNSLEGKRVGLTNGYTYGDAVERSVAFRKEYALSDLQNLRKLAAGRLDYVLMYSRVMDHLVGRHVLEFRGRFQRVGTAIENPLYVTFSPRHPQGEWAMEQLDAGLAVLHRSGRYHQLEQRWAFGKASPGGWHGQRP
ncbi:substrate-binding periplasmic protein [Gulbenkiania mobilis]|uniref:substrate-binding periplasmic protein n=1 Tax=Gulbenkiania mobilis TaxID=397457 RepID=UPI0006BBF895|nr:transporter substrate-binding domain-containing protein [Gulbenkiania mobilis]